MRLMEIATRSNETSGWLLPDCVLVAVAGCAPVAEFRRYETLCIRAEERG